MGPHGNVRTDPEEAENPQREASLRAAVRKDYFVKPELGNLVIGPMGWEAAQEVIARRIRRGDRPQLLRAIEDYAD